VFDSYEDEVVRCECDLTMYYDLVARTEGDRAVVSCWIKAEILS